MRRWLLPEHIEDILPDEARTLERLRRCILDLFASHGYALVQPPLIEYTESLLSGTGRDLDLATFRLADRLSGRQLGIRADHTPQVARIDAHLLNRDGVTRLAYCGSVLHTMPTGLTTTREPIQIGAELYGHAGLEADIEVIRLLASALAAAGVGPAHLDVGHPGLYRALASGLSLEADDAEALFTAVQHKDAASVLALKPAVGEQRASALAALTRLHGGREVIDEARAALPELPGVREALDSLARLGSAVDSPAVSLSFDLAELGGFNYENGIVFAAFMAGSPDAIARGGRYDGVGRAFGRARAATGFTMDLREIAARVPPQPACGAILAPCVEDAALSAEVSRLRAAGEVVIVDLPGHDAARAELGCDRILDKQDGRWVAVALKGA